MSTSGKKKPQAAPKVEGQRKRLPPEERERQIVARAIEYFASEGFSGSTHDLAKEIGITQPLLYRYFPSKQALIERVYQEVYASRWNPEWETLLVDRSIDLAERLKLYSRDYANSILSRNWIRIFIFAGLADQGIHTRYLELLRKRIFLPILREVAFAYDVQEPVTAKDRDEALERIWGWHSSIFYLGVRKWVYGIPLPKDLTELLDQRVDFFLHGFPATLPSKRRAKA